MEFSKEKMVRGKVRENVRKEKKLGSSKNADKYNRISLSYLVF